MFKTAVEAKKALNAKEISAKELVDLSYKNIDAVENNIQALTNLTKDIAYKTAQIVDEKIAKGEELPALAGIPLVIKDNICVNSIFDENGHSNNNAISIFHVHGYLPKHFDEETTHELIFSEEDYHRVYRDAYCWSNIVQLNYLRENSCLFIGCSLTDPNLRRLLDVASRNNEKPRHFALLKRPQIRKTSDISLKDIKVYQKIDMSIKEKCFSMMGINIIWIDDFKEICDILNGLKSN